MANPSGRGAGWHRAAFFKPILSLGLSSRTWRGGYARQPGDLGLLKELGEGVFSLREINGIEYRFRSDGLLDYMQDTNGNRITAGYAIGNLVSLVHSNGTSLALEYSPQGRLQNVTDSTGRELVYGYDASGEHLLSKVGPWGTTTYQYTPDTTGARAHALTEIQHPGSLHTFFAYDDYGRLERSWADDGAGGAVIAYGSASEVRITTQTSGQPSTSRLFFDWRASPRSKTRLDGR